MNAGITKWRSVQFDINIVTNVCVSCKRSLQWIVFSVVAHAHTGFYRRLSVKRPGSFLAAAVWGGQLGGQICIWGPRIQDDIIYDWVNGVIWHRLCDATL